ncbi:MAG: LysM peptidoglycan-binding domain-containing protein [Actinomycetota bacterium]|nr:LysM peptidoglycan-binding domain-containing protein [Actinomycetota bacterium]
MEGHHAAADRLGQALAAASFLYLCGATRQTIRIRRGAGPRPLQKRWRHARLSSRWGLLRGQVIRGLPLIGFLVASLPSTAAARDRAPVSPGRTRPGPQAPWSESSGFPPPHPLGSARAPRRDLEAPPGTLPPGAEGSSPMAGGIEMTPTTSADGRLDRSRPSLAAPWLHPAVHPRPARPPLPVRLFPKASPDHDLPTPDGRDARLEAMRRHPAGKESTTRARADAPHVVRRGETLWSIAADALPTTDAARIDRYWPAVYAANRHIIGADPDHIRPGQRLQLPPERP